MTGRFLDHGMLGAALIGAEETEEAVDVVTSRSLFRHYGPALRGKARRLEARVAETFQAPHALAVNSGTSALRCALAALKLASGDEVIVPPCTFAATANAVVLAGGIPVFSEIDHSLGLDPAALADKITARTVGIIAVHLQGVACRIGEITAEARRRGLWLVEDCAQALGVSYQGNSVGRFGDIGVFSLQAHKTITCGEGGLLITADDALHRRARRFQDQGGERRGDEYPSWEHPDSGFGENLKITELQAGVALAQLRKLPRIRDAMRRVHGQLVERIDLRGRSWRADPDPGGALPYSLVFYAHDAADRERIATGLASLDVPADGLYDQPLYTSGPFVRWAKGEDVFGLPSRAFRPRFLPCPRSEHLMSRIVRIPLSPLYDEAHVAALAACVSQAVADARSP
jgi:8-amino-3,8-dideoxy-alpha-D-manno-octulosonate transaminase